MWRLLEWSAFRSPYRIAEATIPLKDQKTHRELTYGEMTLPTLDQAFQELKLGGGDYLIDLGSGRGKIVLYAAMRGIPSKGFELLPGLVEMARYAAADQFPHASFSQGNFLEADLSEGSVFWVSGTCLGQETRTTLSQKIQKLKHRPLVISVSAPLPSLPTKKILQASTSWGKDCLYIQQAK